MCLGPVSLFLGLLATQLGLLDEAVQSLREATAFAERSGALPCLALSLEAASRALSLRQAPGDRDTAPDAGPRLDDAARDAYRDRIRGLDSALAAADRAGDSVHAERIHDERQALVTELRRATGLAGRPRRMPAEAERARVNVTRTLRAAIARIARAAPIAGAHLDSPSAPASCAATSPRRAARTAGKPDRGICPPVGYGRQPGLQRGPRVPAARDPGGTPAAARGARRPGHVDQDGNLASASGA